MSPDSASGACPEARGRAPLRDNTQARHRRYAVKASIQDKNVQAKVHVGPLILVPVELKPRLDAPNQASLHVGADQGEFGDSLSAVIVLETTKAIKHLHS